MVKVLLICCFLAGCTTAEKQIKIQKVNIPVMYCPKPPLIHRPILPIATITDNDLDGEVVLKYEATIKALQLYASDLESIINFYQDHAK